MLWVHTGSLVLQFLENSHTRNLFLVELNSESVTNNYVATGTAMIHDWVLHSEYEIANWNIWRFWQVFCKKETFAFWQLWITFVNGKHKSRFSILNRFVSNLAEKGRWYRSQTAKNCCLIMACPLLLISSAIVWFTILYFHRLHYRPLSHCLRMVKETFDSNISIATEIIQEMWLAFSCHSICQSR